MSTSRGSAQVPVEAPEEPASTSRRTGRVRPLWVVAALALLALPPAAARIGTDTLVFSPGELADQRAGGTWSEMFALDGVAATIPLPLWLVALVGAGLIGFPYAWVLARALPDRGYGLSRVLGLLLVTWLVWWAASLRALPFGRVAIWLCVLVVAGGAVVIAAAHRDELASWIRSHWRLLLVVEGVFWTLFAAMLFVRWSNPDLWHATRGGEKPMDFAYLNAVVKSTSFPPYDPWFAGGQMNYYYWGFVQVASLAKLTGIPPAIAYNLAIPTLAGLLGSASFSAAYGLVARVGRRTALAVGVLGALFVTVLGNLGELRVLRSSLDGEVPVEWWFWNPTRVIAPGPGEPGPITEFPAFTFIYGDLHAHAMALPLAAVAVALVVALVRDTRDALSTAPLLALLGLVLGALWVTNTWDFPTYLAVACAGLGLVSLRRGLGRRSLAALIASAVGLGVVAYVAFLPFHLRYEAVFQGVQRWRGGTTGLVDYVTVHGLFLFAIASALLVRLAFARDVGSVTRSYRLWVSSWDRLARRRELTAALVHPTVAHRVGVRAVLAAVTFAAALAVIGEWPAAVAVVLATLALLSWPVPRGRRGGEATALRRLALALVLLGLALTVAVEYYVVRNIDIGRTNTVFKLYLQVWVLWALAAAVSVGTVYERLPRIRRSLRETWRLGFAALLTVALLYPVLAARAKIDDRFDTSVGRTLDGTGFMKKAVFRDKDVALPLVHDRDAIRWLLENVDGSPVVAEVNTTPTLYGWQARYAMFTGNPTIVGWDYHQRQQRPGRAEEVQSRVGDVQAAYATGEAARAHEILSRYGAEYAVVGPLERAYFPEGTAKWEEGRGRYWELAYENPGVRVYRLAPDGTR